MNRHQLSLFFTIFTLLTSGLSAAFAQARTNTPVKPEEIQLAPPALTGSVENVSGEYHLKLANNDPARDFRGTAQVAFGGAAEQATVTKIPVTLGPRRSTIFLLYSLPVTGDQYSLMVSDADGKVVLHRIAPVRKITDLSLADQPPTDPKPLRTTPLIEGEIKISASLTGGESEDDPFVLVLEITSPGALPTATLNVTAKGFQQSAKVNITGRTSVEFKLPDELEAQKMNFTLTDALGRVLAKGEADINQLLSDERLAIGDVTPDRETYKPGDVAHLKVALKGGGRGVYQLEIVGKDSRGAVFYRDLRRGSPRDRGGAGQEINLTLPREAGTVKVEIKLTDGETGSQLDSNEREITVADGKADGKPDKLN